MAVRYLSPTGQIEPVVRADHIREAVLHGGADYWAIDAGMASLTRDAAEATEVLHVIANEHAGFFLNFRSDRGVFASVSPDVATDDIVTVYPGGEALELPRRNFVSPHEAWLAIEEFIRQPGLPAALRWEVDTDW